MQNGKFLVARLGITFAVALASVVAAAAANASSTAGIAPSAAHIDYQSITDEANRSPFAFN